MNSVLLIEDSAESQTLVRKALEGTAMVTCVDTRARALSILGQRDFDLIILDLYLPDADGFELLETIRLNPKLRNVPLLILSVRGEVSEKVLGFAKGADDYIVKPFHPLELAARVRSKLRGQSADSQIFAGMFRVDVATHKVFLLQGDAEADLGLTPTEFRIFVHLMRNEGHIISRDKILAKLWPGTRVSNRTVDKHVSSLRYRLGREARLIQSIHGKGYLFNRHGDGGFDSD